jgi:site-specific DNA recombinase
LGAVFLKNLQDKTIRGMQAAVLAGRFAGGRAYGYKRVIRLHAREEVIRGLLAIDEREAAIVRRIYEQFAAGFSSIQIAKQLNEEGVPGPRGGQWNASTIRGDPKKLVGILNNPLYVGRLVWGRRQWRKNPDSDLRERRYRLRDRAEWVEVDVPDLQIVDHTVAAAVHAEMERRERPPAAASPAGKPRARHLLSGLIRCSCCGSSYTISGKDYYRCAGHKERGTCANTVSIRKGPLEEATLSVLQHDLLTDEHAHLFAEEFRREMMRLAEGRGRRDDVDADRLRVINAELANLTDNLLSGILSPTLVRLLGERETEKAELERRVDRFATKPASAANLPHPALLEQFRVKVKDLRAILDRDAVRPEAAKIIAQLIESVTIYPDGEHGPEAEIVARVSDLLTWATNDNAAPRGGVCSSMALVAGTGFEPVTFRL